MPLGPNQQAVAQPMLSGQQGKEAEHGHPAIETFAVGMEPKRGRRRWGTRRGLSGVEAAGTGEAATMKISCLG